MSCVPRPRASSMFRLHIFFRKKCLPATARAYRCCGCSVHNTTERGGKQSTNNTLLMHHRLISAREVGTWGCTACRCYLLDTHDRSAIIISQVLIFSFSDSLWVEVNYNKKTDSMMMTERKNTHTHPVSLYSFLRSNNSLPHARTINQSRQHRTHTYLQKRMPAAAPLTAKLYPSTAPCLTL